MYTSSNVSDQSVHFVSLIRDTVVCYVGLCRICYVGLCRTCYVGLCRILTIVTWQAKAPAMLTRCAGWSAFSLVMCPKLIITYEQKFEAVHKRFFLQKLMKKVNIQHLKPESHLQQRTVWSFFYFQFSEKKIRIGISCALCARQTFLMKCHALFSLKNDKKKKITGCCLLKMRLAL